MKKHWRFYVNCLYWPAWIFYGLLRLMVFLLPFRWQIKAGRTLGRLLYYFSSKSKRTAQVNIKLCFPELSDQERKKMLKKNFQSVGIFFFESALAFWGSEKKLKRIPLTVNNLDVFQRALAKGKGILFAGLHFTTLELIGRLFHLQQPMAVMYRPSKIPFIENLLRPNLERHYCSVIDRDDIRGLYRLLKRNLPVWYAADVDMGRKRSVFVPFFGIQTATMTATARIAKHTGAVVLPITFYRRADDAGYDAFFTALPDDYPTGNDKYDAMVLNQVLEKHVRRAPEQYFWQYKRFKSRPEGEKRFYAKGKS